MSAFLKLRATPPATPLPPPPLARLDGGRGGTSATAAGATTYAFLLESVEGGERLARHSIVGFAPHGLIVGGGGGGSAGTSCSCASACACARSGDPLAHVEEWLSRQQLVVPPSLRGHLPAFAGGAVGYVGYDAVRHFEPRTAGALAAQADSLGIPEAVFMLCDDLVVFDHVRHTVKVVSHLRIAVAAPAPAPTTRAAVEAAYAAAAARIARICERLAMPIPQRGGGGGAPSSPVPLRRVGRNKTEFLTGKYASEVTSVISPTTPPAISTIN